MLEPGDSMTVLVRFGSFDQPNMQPPLDPADLVGIFRIYLTLCPGPGTDECNPLPESERQSNEFLVHY